MIPPLVPDGRGRSRTGERGNVLVFAALLVMILAVLGFSMAEAVVSAKREHSSSRSRLSQLYLAESGLDAAMHSLESGGSGTLGTADSALRLGGGEFWTYATDNGDDTFVVLAAGRFGTRTRMLRGHVRRSTPVFHHAVFAGNASGDADYVLSLGGTGTNGDDVNGNVYSGCSILVDGNATVSGTLLAKDEITGATGVTGVTQPGFDFAGVALSGPEIVDVAAEFTAHATSVADDAGGTAGQVPEENPAHIFRLNPDDRTTETGNTQKNDYFLEDPYEELRTDPNDDGSDPYVISIDGELGAKRRTYFIDGDLWVHNLPTKSFMLQSAVGTGTQVTFLVKGNIHLCDSFRYGNTERDAVAFIALVDPNVSDSGNIYFGDAQYGTLKEMHAFLYAENDLKDVNMDINGFKAARILGAMTAGNHVDIERDYEGGLHSKLTVDFDGRLQAETTSLPFMAEAVPDSVCVLEMWLEVAPGGN